MPNKSKYAISWETQAKNFLRQCCFLLEHQSLVDVLICCGGNSIQAHKVVLAANSSYFRGEFEKNPEIEQIVVSGVDFSVIKNVIELMYCGYTVVAEESIKYLVALIKQYQVRCLEDLFKDHPENVDDIFIPKPQFLTKKPKYPTLPYGCQGNSTVSNSASQSRPPKTSSLGQSLNAEGAVDSPSARPQKQAKPSAQGRKKLTMQAEQACVKEAQASRMALANLQKEISASPQVNSFIIEDSCTETTVENFIPHPDQTTSNFVQLVNYPNNRFLPVPSTSGSTQTSTAHVKDKLKNILGPDMPSNVEIMFKDSEGNFVTVTEEVLQSLSTKEGLQYQVIDEDGHIGELQELQDIDRIEKLIESNVAGSGKEALSNLTPVSTINLEVTADGQLVPSLMETTNLNLDGKCCVIGADGKEYTLQDAAETWRKKLSIKAEQEQFSPDMFFADLSTADEKTAENMIKNAEIQFGMPEDLSVNKENLVPDHLDCRFEEDMEICD